MAHKVLLVEDEPRMRQVIMMQLSDLPLTFIEAGDGQQAMSQLDQEDFSLVITDLKLPIVSGMELLGHIKQHIPELPVIVITAYGSIENAVQAIRKGAFDYVTKPFEEERLRGCVKKALKISRLMSQVRYLREEIEGKYHFDNIRGVSPEICHVLNLAGEVATTNTTVLITGESGTGKELLAKAIHFNSQRVDDPFLPINCAAIPPTLLEAELFGYEPGAFTGANHRKKGKFELASGGTLFLDEIGDMEMGVQARLLRVIESQQFYRVGGTRSIDVDIRIISATNKDLDKSVATGLFREDLYYRLSVFPIHIPPLREHKDDIPVLCDYFTNKFAAALGKRTPKISSAASKKLKEHPWHGNVRELKNVIERAMILCKGDQITSTHLVLQQSAQTVFDPSDLEALATVLIDTGGVDIKDLEIRLLYRAIHQSRYNVSKAARLLRLTRPTLRYRLDKYGISDEVFANK
jgi:DNA-binding NtrC family response regulator